MTPMSEVRHGIYEGMFLFPQSAAADMRGVVDHVQSILKRAGAELVAIQKWDERRLAYDIASNKRGLYILTYFKSDRSQIPTIERACNLSELMLRAMILRADHVPAEEIEAADQREALDDEIKLREIQAVEDAKAAEAAAIAAAAAVAAAAEATAEAEAPAAEVEAPAAEAEAPAAEAEAPAAEAEAPAAVPAEPETAPDDKADDKA
jgi:small subunit ribosomal protein S6